MMIKRIGVLVSVMLIGGAVWAVSGSHTTSLVAADKTQAVRFAPRESKRLSVEPIGQRNVTTNAEREPILPSHAVRNPAPTGQAA